MEKRTFGLDLEAKVDGEYGSAEIGTVKFAWGEIRIQKGGAKTWSNTRAKFGADIRFNDGSNCGELLPSEKDLLSWLSNLKAMEGQFCILQCQRNRLFDEIKPLQNEASEIQHKLFELVKKAGD